MLNPGETKSFVRVDGCTEAVLGGRVLLVENSQPVSGVMISLVPSGRGLWGGKERTLGTTNEEGLFSVTATVGVSGQFYRGESRKRELESTVEQLGDRIEQPSVHFLRIREWPQGKGWVDGFSISLNKHGLRPIHLHVDDHESTMSPVHHFFLGDIRMQEGDDPTPLICKLSNVMLW